MTDQDERRIQQKAHLRALLEKKTELAGGEENIPTASEEKEAQVQAIEESKHDVNLFNEREETVNQEKDVNKILADMNLVESTNLHSSKAIPSTFYHTPNQTQNKAKAQDIKHSSSKNLMAGTKAQLKGATLKGVVSRHSHQASVRNVKKGGGGENGGGGGDQI